MTKSPIVVALGDIQNSIMARLREDGVRRIGRTYNRVTENDLVHVIGPQSGSHLIGHPPLPNVPDDHYGMFAVYLGVFLRCVSEIERLRPKARAVQEYNCEIRWRLRSPEGPDEETWWDARAPTEKTASSLERPLLDEGAPHLADYGSYADVLEQFSRHGVLPRSERGT